MILQCLREQTHDCHKRLEQRLDLLDTMLSLERYRALLRRFYGFYIPMERRLGEVFSQGSDLVQFSRRRKVGYLAQDLEILGVTQEYQESLPLCDSLPIVALLPQALGCLYVLEGSTLGGQIISRHLERTHGIGIENGGAFFLSYGPDVAMMWRAFGTALTAYAAEHDEDARIIQAARETFSALEAWLCNE